MRILVFTAVAASLLTGCREANPVIEVTDTRRLTYLDKDPGVFVDVPPPGWRSLPPRKLRDRNFLAGPNEEVEIYVSYDVQGGDLANANRWLGQFGLTPVRDPDAFQKITILGKSSPLVEAEGTFTGGMDGEPTEDYALVGALWPNGPSVMTIKMVGPADQVRALRDEFIAYCESIRFTKVAKIGKPAEGEKNAE